MALLLRFYKHPDGTENEEWQPGATKQYRMVPGKPIDYPDHETIVHNKGTDKEVTVLMRKPHSFPATPYGGPLVESFCRHGLAAHPDGRPHRVGNSWVLSKYMRVEGWTPPHAGCVICFGEEKPADWPEEPAQAVA